MSVPTKLSKAGSSTESLRSHGYRRRLICTIDGEEKEGKSHLSASAPGPLRVLTTEPVRWEGLPEKFPDKIIDILPLVNKGVGRLYMDEKDHDHVLKVREFYTRIWETFESAYYDALDEELWRTVVVENGSTLYQWSRLAEFGKTEQVPQLKYGPINAGWNRIIQEAQNSNKNVIFVHRLEDEYRKLRPTDEKASPTGRLVRYGSRVVGPGVQAIVRAFRVRDREDANYGEFGFEIMDAGQRPSAMGEMVIGSDTAPYGETPEVCNFLTLALRIYGDEALEDFLE